MTRIGGAGAPIQAPPPGKDLPLDGHLHTDRSHDSRVPIDAYAALAIANRIPEIAITDHVDFDPALPGYLPDEQSRQRMVREAAERWAPHGVAIRFGVEISYEIEREDEIRAFMRGIPYDYAIGSVHVGPRSPFHRDSVAGWARGRPIGEVVAPYFEEVAAAARSGLFDTIGHLDFVKRYVAAHVTPAELAAAPEVYEPVLRALVEHGVALEVNTSGLRQVARETYPAPWVVARYRELGGRHVVSGSDAHVEGHFGSGLDLGYAAIRDAGFEVLTFRRGGGRVTIDMPRPNASARPSFTP